MHSEDGGEPAAGPGARQTALALLARREHSPTELRRKLRSRGFEEAEIDAQLAELRERGWLSEERFVESFVHARIDRGQGPITITAALRERGIGDALAERFLTASSAWWCERAEAARRKRFGAALPESPREWSRQARFLAGRGFPADLVYRVLGGLDE